MRQANCKHRKTYGFVKKKNKSDTQQKCFYILWFTHFTTNFNKLRIKPYFYTYCKSSSNSSVL